MLESLNGIYPGVCIYRSCGNWETVGWYYRIDGGSPVGPFPNTIAAGNAAMAEIRNTELPGRRS